MRKTFFILFMFCLTVLVYAQDRLQSKIEDGVFTSKILNAEREYAVYLPKSYDIEQDKQYPILYLLHGMTETNKVWFDRGHVKDIMDQLVNSEEVDEMIIIAPNAGGRFEDNAWNGYFDMPGWAYEAFFFEEFMPFVEAKYRVIGDKLHRAIAGLSMGGGGATAYGQKHNDKFCAVYAMSALMSIPESGAQRFENPKDKFGLLTLSVIENSCIKYIEKAGEERKKQLRSVAWFVDCGDDDFLLDRNIDFFRAMQRAQIPCQFRVRDGGHTWEYWQSALYMCLPFVSRQFNKRK